ncbi:MAG: hypothetical protein HKN89_05675 [Eudoraea sp.]|nr:hypothetical protein [Eudoraea sp.]
MKKSPLLLLLAVILVSCSISKEVGDQRNLISGSWTLTDISFENNEGTFTAVLFDDADAICFEGSDWFFRDNNSTARYTLEQGSLCEGGDRFIRWSVVRPDQNFESQLQFKFIDDKRKDISNGLGYKLNIAELTSANMTLKSKVTVEGEPITLVYKFSKK